MRLLLLYAGPDGGADTAPGGITSTTLSERLLKASDDDDDRSVAMSRELRNATGELPKINGLNVPVAQ
jgi:hypothetical protein